MKKARMLQPRTTGRATGRGSGFTLIEILIVIGIMMLLTAIVLGTITRLGSSNRRMTCQSNLSQIYQACRLYQQDEGGFPYFDPHNVDTGAEINIGLWALYAFPKSSEPYRADPDSPVGRYIRSTRALHCPQDSPVGLLNPLDSTRFNDQYLSYQKLDDNGTPSDPDDDQQSYASLRPTPGADWKRQLVPFNGVRVFRAPADNTVVTWCPFHRKAVGGRDFDNVLFYDGSVQLLPRQQDDSSIGWKRLPKAPQ